MGDCYVLTRLVPALRFPWSQKKAFGWDYKKKKLRSPVCILYARKKITYTCGDSGVPAKEFQEVYPKVGDLHHSGMAHIGECLGCLASLSQVHDQLHGQVTRQCYIHARKSKVGKPWTMKMTDSSGDALYNKVQNQQWPCRNTELVLVDINPASFFHHSYL